MATRRAFLSDIVSTYFADQKAVLVLVIAIIIFGASSVFVLVNFELLKLIMILAILLVVVLVIMSPLVGLCMLGATIPYAGLLSLIPDAFTANKLLAILLAISFFLHSFITQSKRWLIPSKAFLYYMLLPALGLLTLPFALAQSKGLLSLVTLLLLTGMTYLTAVILQNDRQLKVLCFVSTLSGSLLGVYIMFWGLEGLTRGGYSVRLAAATNENVLAHALAMCMLLSLFAFKDSKKVTILLLLVMDLFLLYSITLTGSRSVWVSLLVCLVFPPLFVPGVHLKTRLRILVFACTFISLGFYGMTHNAFGPYERIFERVYEIDTSREAVGGRLEHIWPNYVDYIIQSPVIGNGLGFKSLAPKASHNNILFVGSHFGIIGLLVYFMMWFYLIKESLQLHDTWKRVFLIILLVFLFLSGMTHDTLTLKSSAFVFGVIFYIIGQHTLSAKVLPKP